MQTANEPTSTPPHGWATTRTGKTFHHFGGHYEQGVPKAFCHWGLTPAPKSELLEQAPTAQTCPTCLARYGSWKKGQQAVHWTLPPPLPPTSLDRGVRVQITARSHKDHYGTVLVEDGQHPGFWWVEVVTNGRAKEFMFSAGQLLIKPSC